jgi:hypothetical protein
MPGLAPVRYFVELPYMLAALGWLFVVLVLTGALLVWIWRPPRNVVRMDPDVPNWVDGEVRRVLHDLEARVPVWEPVDVYVTLDTPVAENNRLPLGLCTAREITVFWSLIEQVAEGDADRAKRILARVLAHEWAHARGLGHDRIGETIPLR